MLLVLAAALVLSASDGSGSESQTSALRTFYLTDPRSGPCALWTAMEQWARQARVRVGFEAALQCSPGRKVLEAGYEAVVFERTTPTRALELLLQLAPDFTWRNVGGIVVVRPKQAWTDPGSPLKQPLQPFQVTGAHPQIAVHEALEAAQPPLLMPQTALDGPTIGRQIRDRIAVQFDGGTLLDALNAIIWEFEGMWQIGYTGKAFHVVLHTFDFEEDGGIITGRLPGR